MLPVSALLLLLGLGSAACFELLPEEAAPRRARFSANSPSKSRFYLTSSIWCIVFFICGVKHYFVLLSLWFLCLWWWNVIYSSRAAVLGLPLCYFYHTVGVYVLHGLDCRPELFRLLLLHCLCTFFNCFKWSKDVISGGWNTLTLRPLVEIKHSPLRLLGLMSHE